MLKDQFMTTHLCSTQVGSHHPAESRLALLLGAVFPASVAPRRRPPTWWPVRSRPQASRGSGGPAAGGAQYPLAVLGRIL